VAYLCGFELSTVAPKPRAEGSSPSAPAKVRCLKNGLDKPFLRLFLFAEIFSVGNFFWIF
jgi:hypothetical protein